MPNHVNIMSLDLFIHIPLINLEDKELCNFPNTSKMVGMPNCHKYSYQFNKISNIIYNGWHSMFLRYNSYFLEINPKISKYSHNYFFSFLFIFKSQIFNF